MWLLCILKRLLKKSLAARILLLRRWTSSPSFTPRSSLTNGNRKMPRNDSTISPARSMNLVPVHKLNANANRPRSDLMNLDWTPDTSTSRYSMFSDGTQSIYAPPTPQTGLLDGHHGLMLPPAASAYNMLPSPPGFMDPSTLSVGPSDLSLNAGRCLLFSPSAEVRLRRYRTNA